MHTASSYHTVRMHTSQASTSSYAQYHNIMLTSRILLQQQYAYSSQYYYFSTSCSTRVCILILQQSSTLVVCLFIRTLLRTLGVLLAISTSQQYLCIVRRGILQLLARVVYELVLLACSTTCKQQLVCCIDPFPVCIEQKRSN